MKLKITLAFGTPAAKERVRQLQRMLTAVAVAFGHSLLMKEIAYPQTPCSEDAVEAADALLCVSFTPMQRQALWRQLDCFAGASICYRHEALQENSLRKDGMLPQGYLLYPMDHDLDPQAQMDKALACARQWAQPNGLTLRAVADGVALIAPDPAIERLAWPEALQDCIRRPEQLGVLLLPGAQAETMESVYTALAGVQGLYHSRWLHPQGCAFAADGLLAPPAGADTPVGLLACGADMLAYGLHLQQEADCARTAMNNVIAAGWRTPDMSEGTGPRISGEGFCNLVCEQIDLVGELLK